MDFTHSTALSHKANLIIIFAILIWAFLLYGNTVLNKYSIGDRQVTNNDLVRQGFKAIPNIVSSFLVDEEKTAGGQSIGYMPVARSMYAIEYGLWGEKPSLSHLINVLIFFISSLITFNVIQRLLNSYNILFPVLVIFLFMAHPVHTEVVAHLANRDEMMSYLFGMAGMNSLISYTRTHRVRYILHCSIWFFLACLTKLSAIPFIGLYVLVLYFFSNLKPNTILTITGIIILAGIVAFLVPWLVIPHSFHTGFYYENPLYFERNLWLRLGTAMVSLLFYLRILLFPYPLLFYYGYNVIPLTSLFNPLAMLSLLIYVILLIYSIVNIRRKTLLSFAILWYLISIYLYSNLLFPVAGIVAERFVFLASLGFVMAVVFMIFRIFSTEPNSLTIEFESRFKIIGLVIVILIPSLVLTLNRNINWKNETSLFTKDIPHLTKSAKANYEFAGFLMKGLNEDANIEGSGQSGQILHETIKKHLRFSLKIYPESFNALNDLGTIYLFIEKNYDSALCYFQKAVAVNPMFTEGWTNMGMAYHQIGVYSKAMSCYERVLEIKPGDASAYMAIGDLYNDLGDVNEARYYYDLGRKAAGKK